MKNLIEIVNELEGAISNFEKTNPLISTATVGWQIDHSLRVLNGIILQLKKSDPEDYKWEFSFNRILVFTTNRIPRGKVKAPKTVTPDTVATVMELKEKLELVKQEILDLHSLPKNHFFSHPHFKKLNLKQTQKFLEIHTFHHLKIIRAILK